MKAKLCNTHAVALQTRLAFPAGAGSTATIALDSAGVVTVMTGIIGVFLRFSDTARQTKEGLLKQSITL